MIKYKYHGFSEVKRVKFSFYIFIAIACMIALLFFYNTRERFEEAKNIKGFPVPYGSFEKGNHYYYPKLESSNKIPKNYERAIKKAGWIERNVFDHNYLFSKNKRTVTLSISSDGFVLKEDLKPYCHLEKVDTKVDNTNVPPVFHFNILVKNKFGSKVKAFYPHFEGDAGGFPNISTTIRQQDKTHTSVSGYIILSPDVQSVVLESIDIMVDDQVLSFNIEH
jgi:hypothetical protein